MPPGGDAYLASLVLHNSADQDAERILANIATAGGSGTRLLLLDFVVPPGDTPHLAKISDLSMLVMVGGKERTESEWRDRLRTARERLTDGSGPARRLTSAAGPQAPTARARLNVTAGC